MEKFSSHKKGGHFLQNSLKQNLQNIKGRLGGDMWKNSHLVKKEGKILQKYDI